VIWIYKYKSPELERLLEAGLIHRLIHGPVTYEQIQRICGYSDTAGDDDGMNGSFDRETPNPKIKCNVGKNRGGSSCVHRVIIIDDLLKSMAKVRECVRVCVCVRVCACIRVCKLPTKNENLHIVFPFLGNKPLLFNRSSSWGFLYYHWANAL